MALVNETTNTGSLTNEPYKSSSLTWDQATFTWDEAVGTWDNPYSMNNETANTGSVTNESQNPLP